MFLFSSNFPTTFPRIFFPISSALVVLATEVLVLVIVVVAVTALVVAVEAVVVVVVVAYNIAFLVNRSSPLTLPENS